MHDVINMEKGLLLLCTRRFDSSREGVSQLPIVIKSPTGLSQKIISIIKGPAFAQLRVSHHINTSLLRTQASPLYLAHIVSHGKGTPYLARLVCPYNYGLCFLAVVHAIVVVPEGRKLEKFHLPGFCDSLIGSFTFSRTQILPTELFVIFIMICDMFNNVLGITGIMHFNKCPSSCRD